MTGLNKGNLSIYKPNSNTIYIANKNCSPTLIKIVKTIKRSNSFLNNDYTELSRKEKLIVDKIINLLRLDSTDIDKESDKVNYELKNRYAILIGELGAGNQSTLIIDEIKQVITDLYKNKALSLSKKKDIFRELRALREM